MNYSEVSRTLTESLGLNHAPVSIGFADSEAAGVGRRTGEAPAGCRFWQDGALSTFTTSAADHASCAVGMWTHNLAQTAAQQSDLTDALAIFQDLGYVSETDLPQIPVLKSQPRHVIYGPLAETTLDPALVLLFVNAAQALVACEAAQQIENQVLPSMGRPACAIVPLVANTGQAALSFGCCGARAYLDTFAPDVSIFAIPGSKLDRYASRIRQLASANAMLAQFHQIRRTQIEAGLQPTVKESLTACEATPA